MNSIAPAVYRLLFPLAPVLAVVALSFVDIPMPARGAPQDPASAAAKSAGSPDQNAVPECCRKTPSRFGALPKYLVKFAGAGANGVDYDAGNKMISIRCAFDDLNPEQPVVGMSEVGLLTSIQTDTGILVEGNAGFGIISPTVHEFKDAQFSLSAKVPLATKSFSMVSGCITVQRARERGLLRWHEPFGPEVGSMRKTGDYEFVLAKCEIQNDTLTAEWTCKIPMDGAADSKLWKTRQLKTELICADKTVLVPESGAMSQTKIVRMFRLNHKFPVSLEVSFISDLRLENLPFVLTGIALEGNAPKKSEVVSDQNF